MKLWTKGGSARRIFDRDEWVAEGATEARRDQIVAEHNWVERLRGTMAPGRPLSDMQVTADILDEIRSETHAEATTRP